MGSTEQVLEAQAVVPAQQWAAQELAAQVRPPGVQVFAPSQVIPQRVLAVQSTPDRHEVPFRHRTSHSRPPQLTLPL